MTEFAFKSDDKYQELSVYQYISYILGFKQHKNLSVPLILHNLLGTFYNTNL